VKYVQARSGESDAVLLDCREVLLLDSAVVQESRLSTGVRPRLTSTPSKPSLFASATASTLPVWRKFQSVTPTLNAGLACDKREKAVPAATT